MTAADELTERDALSAHLAVELGLDQEELAHPWSAAGSSAVAFTAGALLPLLAILLPPASVRIVVAFVAVVVGLVATGMLSAHLGGSPKRAAVLRLVIGGVLAMGVTFGIGSLVGGVTG